ncbi:hypothetical protein Geezett_011 [Klebsiella phage Geezett]|uniref:Uncharacterized protein n=1 Tax=Klebsiella phage Geezett TaxID=2861002 RepID=A0AAE7VJS0_9CAUD|nr:hypothetical protein PQZ59_gp11 [Klebsiella phage Geezett]QXV72083.1 hypothetical protein Geezett_011 [Klebsiella phage Geezett]
MRKVKVIDNKGNNWFVNGKSYEVVRGEIGNGFFIKDEDCDTVFQYQLDGEHALFEDVSDGE